MNASRLTSRSIWTTVRQLSAAAALATAALSCSGTTPTQPHRPRLFTKVVELRDPDAELWLDRACAATGIETCFNATDEDCDGFVDEGCGLPSGALQVVVAWADPEADVNLEMTDPNGERVLVGQHTALGLTKDRDCPGKQDQCGGQNFEVVTCSGPQPARGRYRAELVLDRPPSTPRDVSVTMGGHWGRQSIRGRFVLTVNKPSISVEFLSYTAPVTHGDRAPK